MTKSVDDMTETERFRHWQEVAGRWLTVGPDIEVTNIVESQEGSEATVTLRRKSDAHRT